LKVILKIKDLVNLILKTKGLIHEGRLLHTNTALSAELARANANCKKIHADLENKGVSYRDIENKELIDWDIENK